MEGSEKELSQEELQAIEDAAFAAEMSGEAVDVNTPKLEPEIKQEEEQTAQAETEQETQPERVEVIPGYTQEELNQLKEHVALIPKLQKALDTTNGTYGNKIAELQRVIDGLKTQQPAAAAAVTLTSEKFKKLSQAYPELAEALAEDLNGIIHKGDQSIDFEKYKQELDDRFGQRVAEIESRELEKAAKRLKKNHSDYAEVASWKQDENGVIHFNDMKFGNWISQQPREIQDVVLTSNDPDDVSDVLDNYKKSLKPAEPETKSILERAVQPKGVKTTSIGKTDQELEEEAFQEEMKKGYV